MGKRGVTSAVELVAKQGDQIELQPFVGNVKTQCYDYNPRSVKTFFESFKVPSGLLVGKHMQLYPWQFNFIKKFYRTGVRQGILSVPRKCGKTALSAALCLYHLCGDGSERFGEVYSAAVDKNQAAIIFRMMLTLIAQCSALEKRLIVRAHEKTITDVKTGSIYKALSADATTKHGTSSSFVIYDELAQAPNRELYDVLVTSMSARKSPRMLVISTQASTNEHVLSELIDYAAKGTDKTIVSAVHSAPEEADIFDERVWRDCNPSLGTVKSIDDMRSLAGMAKQLPARQAAFKNLHLNMRVRTDSSFMPISAWDACYEDFTAEDLYNQECILSADLASVRDLCSLCLFFPQSGHVISHNFTNDSQLDNERVPFKTWVAEGKLISTPGDTTNKQYIVHCIKQLLDKYQVTAFVFDRWGMPELKRLMSENDVIVPELVEFGQGYISMSPAINAFERAILERTLKHNGDPILRWTFQNLATVNDPAGNRKFNKAKALDRIDPMIALVMALGHVNSNEAHSYSIDVLC